MKALKASEKKLLESLKTRKTDSDLLIGDALAKKALDVAQILDRQIALLISREGKVLSVTLGTKSRVYLPDLGRFRVGPGRLRRVRAIIFAPIPTDLPRDLITDLEKLRLDAVALYDGRLQAAYIDPYPGANAHQLSYSSLYEQEPDMQARVAEIEQALSKASESKAVDTTDRAILVGVYSGSMPQALLSMEELSLLADSASVEVVDEVIQRRKNIDPKHVLGKGKLEDVILSALDLGVELLIFDGELTPTQLRNITSLTDLKIIDRSMLILDIFAKRAVSSEGRLQVELAQLRYTMSRLSEKDDRLSRLTGGIGGRGPGETKLEIGRRRVRDRVNFLEKKVDDISSQRRLRRQQRVNRGVPVIAVVGYTNAGKSTLVREMTKTEVFVEDKLFATLDTSSRRMRFPNEKEAVFVDTVGFIRELPKELINAFRATLEEIGEADILCHVMDASDPDLLLHKEIVTETIKDLGYDSTPVIHVLNKIDKVTEIQAKTLAASSDAVHVSAITKHGFTELIERLQQKLLVYFKKQDPGRFLEQEMKCQ